LYSAYKSKESLGASVANLSDYTHTYTHNRFTALFLGPPG